MLKKRTILPFLAILVMACLAFAPHSYAQTRSAGGIHTGGDSISVLVPEVGGIESRVNEVTALKTEIEQCGTTNQFYDPNTDTCRTTDPIEVTFSNTGATTLRIQHPDGSYSTHNLDGGDGTATVVGSCTRPWGGTVANGASITAYQASSVACGSACASQTRVCNNGTLSGSYTNQSCSVQSCSGVWTLISQKIDATIGCGESASFAMCDGPNAPTGSCTVGQTYTQCHNLIGNFKCREAHYQCTAN